jgi:membrane protease YdiL (CAAX protease family)
MAAFVWFGARRRGVTIAELVGGRWSSFMDVLRDIGIGIGFLFAAGIVLQLVSHLLRATPTRALKAILPSGTAEMILWVAMSISAGFCEELIFRGYFQRQFAALTRSAVGGILLQGIFFGAAHGYQGWRLMTVIAVFGTMFGALAEWRQSTRPGMFAHALQDTLGGLLGRHLMR